MARAAPIARQRRAGADHVGAGTVEAMRRRLNAEQWVACDLVAQVLGPADGDIDRLSKRGGCAVPVIKGARHDAADAQLVGGAQPPDHSRVRRRAHRKVADGRRAAAQHLTKGEQGAQIDQVRLEVGAVLVEAARPPLEEGEVVSAAQERLEAVVVDVDAPWNQRCVGVIDEAVAWLGLCAHLEDDAIAADPQDAAVVIGAVTVDTASRWAVITRCLLQTEARAAARAAAETGRLRSGRGATRGARAHPRSSRRVR